ncbi:Protein IQ-DOMAIN 1 [Heracleum sosnowskyi]|uniref:Protein IQ-DOMAIN 1 n=1 Tax=Heracleum sosnowskyi TaxID=360622 RepID=A0AAD8I615_9APIA|nr:Protein IQ-DOMAIN 1 [Heracleum sosnowskyi]
MGSGDWLKKIVGLKKLKNGKPKYLKGSSLLQNANGLTKNDPNLSHHAPNGIPGISVQDLAATRIQTAFRAYRARKTRRQLKGTVKLRAVTLGSSSRKQASTTLKYLHTWSRLQTEIRTRRNIMAVEARIKQRKLENQLKLETKLHDLEVEWSNGPETMEEVLARIHLREEASVKRERAMAYAFSHQWRANSNPILGSYELGKAIWGWSWMERWVAARPWESRALIQSSPKKAMSSKQASKTAKNTKSPTIKSINSVKSISPNGKLTTNPRRLSFGAADQPANTKKESIVS